MEWIRVVLVLLLLTRVIYTDMKSGIIENRSVWTGLMTGSIWTLCNDGMYGLLESIRMVLIILAVLWVLFLIRGLGAGDIKLLCVLAAFYPDGVVEISIIAFLVAAGLVFARILIRWVRKLPVYMRGEVINFSLPIGIATIIIMLQAGIR